jgi:hypothetical protein
VGELHARLDTEWIPLFGKSTLGCERQLATVLRAAGRSDIRVHDLPRRLYICANSIWLVAESEPVGPDPLKRMGRLFVNAPSDARMLLNALSDALEGVDADEPTAELRTCRPTSSETAACEAEPSQHPSSGAAEKTALKTMEQDIVEAIQEDGRMTTDPLGKKAGYSVSSIVKQKLAGMVRRSILINLHDNRRRGYELRPEFDARSARSMCNPARPGIPSAELASL